MNGIIYVLIFTGLFCGGLAVAGWFAEEICRDLLPPEEDGD